MTPPVRDPFTPAPHRWAGPSAGMFLLVALVAAASSSCSTDTAAVTARSSPITSIWPSDDEELRPDGAISVIALDTPDGSGQTVHPDFAAMPEWAPTHFLVATPYTDSRTGLENPTLFARNDDFSWSLLHGVRDPLATSDKGYLSDPDMVAVPDKHELWIYYREVVLTNIIHLIRSYDGVHFSTPRTVVEAPNHEIISPAVVRRSATDWLMWSVNAGVAGCSAPQTKIELRRSSNGIDWSDPITSDLPRPAGYSAWHIDVQWIPSRSEYWALYNVKQPGSCSTPALYLAVSADAVNWQTYPTPVLSAGAIPEFADIVYRSTFAYDSATDNIRFWYSGARFDSTGYVWRTAYQRRKRADVFRSIMMVTVPQPSALRIARRNVPPLLDGP